MLVLIDLSLNHDSVFVLDPHEFKSSSFRLLQLRGLGKRSLEVWRKKKIWTGYFSGGSLKSESNSV